MELLDKIKYIVDTVNKGLVCTSYLAVNAYEDITKVNGEYVLLSINTFRGNCVRRIDTLSLLEIARINENYDEIINKR